MVYTVARVVQTPDYMVRLNPNEFDSPVLPLNGAEGLNPELAHGEDVVIMYANPAHTEATYHTAARYVRRAFKNEPLGGSWGDSAERGRVEEARAGKVPASPELVAELQRLNGEIGRLHDQIGDAIQAAGINVGEYIAPELLSLEPLEPLRMQHEIVRQTVASYSYTKAATPQGAIGVTVTVTGTDLADMKDKFAKARDQLFGEVDVLMGHKQPDQI